MDSAGIDEWIRRGDWSQPSRAQLVSTQRDQLWALFYLGLRDVSEALWAELELDAAKASEQLVHAFGERATFRPTADMKDYRLFTRGNFWLSWLVTREALGAARGRLRRSQAEPRRQTAPASPSLPLGLHEAEGVLELKRLAERVGCTLSQLGARTCIEMCALWLDATEDEREAHGLVTTVRASRPVLRSDTEVSALRADARLRFQALHEGLAAANIAPPLRVAIVHLFDKVPATPPYRKEWRDLGLLLGATKRLQTLDLMRASLVVLVTTLLDLAEGRSADTPFEEGLRAGAVSLTLLHAYHLDRVELQALHVRVAQMRRSDAEAT